MNHSERCWASANALNFHVDRFHTVGLEHVAAEVLLTTRRSRFIAVDAADGILSSTTEVCREVWSAIQEMS